MSPYFRRSPTIINYARSRPLPPELALRVLQSARRHTLGIATDASSGAAMTRRRR